MKLNTMRMEGRISSLFSLRRGLALLKKLGILILCLSILNYPIASQAEVLTSVQSDYDKSVCSEKPSGQTGTHCAAAKSQLLAADVATATASLMAGVVVVCTLGCTGNVTADSLCLWLDLAVMVGDVIATATVTKEYTAIATGLTSTMMTVGMLFMMRPSTPTDAAAKSVEKGTQEGAEKAERKKNMGSCMALAMALMMIAMKVMTAQMAVEGAAKEIKTAEGLRGSGITQVITSGGNNGPNMPTPESGNTGNMGGVRNPSGQNDLNTSNNPQQAAAQASKIGVVLPPKLTSPPFAAGFENLTGQPLNNFLAQTRNDPQGAAVAALSTAMAPSDAQKFMGAASDGVSKLLAKGYSLANATGTTYSGGGGGRGGGGGSPEEDAMAQMLGGLMGKLGAAQGQEQENPYGMTKVIGFTGKKLENTGISLDRTENLFEKVSIRYSKIERGML